MTDQIQAELFKDHPGLEEAPERVSVPLAGVARVLLPNRVQLELRACDLESLLPEGHRARLVWAWVERADLSAMSAGIRAVDGGSGRTAIAAEILFALWLYATLEGVGSARAVARFTQEHDAYRCGIMSQPHIVIRSMSYARLCGTWLCPEPAGHGDLAEFW